MSECDVLDIHTVMKRLAEKRPIFHSEADFQFALAWQIRELVSDSKIRLEFSPFPDESKRMDLDIWVPSERSAIEVKYPKDHLDVTVNGERFLLKQGADDIARYDFVRDIARMEKVVAEREDADHGIAVLLTNWRALWNPPAQNRKVPNDAEFRLHEGRVLIGELHWTNKPQGAERKSPILLNGSYEMRWHDYRDRKLGKNSHFRYLAVEIGN